MRAGNAPARRATATRSRSAIAAEHRALTAWVVQQAERDQRDKEREKEAEARREADQRASAEAYYREMERRNNH